MSRHRRQRNRRWQQTLSSVNVELINYGKRVWKEHGKISTRLSPLEKLMLKAWIKKEDIYRTPGLK